jgi:hypothetical protein
MDLGIAPSFSTYSGTDPVGFVVSKNLHRRHLSESQRAMVGDKIAILRDGQRRGSGEGRQICPPSQAEAAAMLNVGERSVQSARVVLDLGTPDPVGFVVSKNLHRRHLTKADLIDVVPKIEHAYREQARGRQIAGGSHVLSPNLDEGGRATDDMASALGVSRGTIDNALAVAREGIEELKDAVRKGQASVSAAALVAREEPEVQREIVARGEHSTRNEPSTPTSRNETTTPTAQPDTRRLQAGIGETVQQDEEGCWWQGR